MSLVGIEEIRFGPFRVAVRSRTLCAEGKTINLTSRAFDMLLALIEHRHAPISKDDLMRLVWPNVIVEENNLHVQMAAVRRALSPHQTLIITIPGKGYRFVGDVELITKIAESPEPALAAPPGECDVPAQVTTMMDRVEELTSLKRLLRESRMVSLCGPGGVGKTRLAIEAARGLHPDFAGGCRWVSLASATSAELVAETVASAIHAEELRGKPLIESLAASFRQRPVLLVLDGAEHVLRAVGELAAMLLARCPELVILCTSLGPLEIAGERIMRLAPLSLPPLDEPLTMANAAQYSAIALFAERAGAIDQRFRLGETTLQPVAEICHHLDGNPLAIELAAARVPLLGLEPVRSRIANQLALLGGEADAAPDRQRTLRATIAWSYGLLTEPDRLLLRLLSIFTGGFTLDAAQQVAETMGLQEWDAINGISRLVARSQLSTGADMVNLRYHMARATREFCREELHAAGEFDATARAHARYWLDFAAAGEMAWETGSGSEWVAAINPELENLRSALDWSLSPQGDITLGVRLSAVTARYWFEAGHFSEGRSRLTRALDNAPADTRPVTHLRLWRALSDLSIDGKSALDAARKAVAIAETVDDGEEIGVCQRAEGAALYRLGQFAESEALALRALERLRDSTRLHSLAKCVADLCILRGVEGDFAAARRYQAEAQARLVALGDDRGVAICLQYAAEIEFTAGEIDGAVVSAEQSVALFRALKSLYPLEIGLGNLAAYRLAQNEPTAALAAAREALTIASDIGDQPGFVIALEHIALASALRQDFESSLLLLGYVEETYRVHRMQRQETEQLMHDRLQEILAQSVAGARREILVAQGRMLSVKAVRALALGQAV